MNSFPVKVVACITLVLFLHAGFALAADQVYFYYTDPAGTPLAMSDDKGNVVWKADYMPFGEELLDATTIENNKMFVGKEKDKETGLYYFGARYMESAIGRFTSPDPIRPVNLATGKLNDEMLRNPQRLNFYAYGLNNPYRYLDTDGQWSEKIHNHIINMAFSSGNYRLSNDIKAIFMQASKDADKDQSTFYAYKHAMRGEWGNEITNERWTHSFIQDKIGEYKNYISQGETDKAYYALGIAMHALMDSTSPSHERFQRWYGMTVAGLIPGIEHWMGERDSVFYSDINYLQKSFALVRKLFDEANR